MFGENLKLFLMENNINMPITDLLKIYEEVP